MAITWPQKDPNEVLDYALNWTGRLTGDTIATSVWTVPAGITSNSETVSDKQTVIWLSGGSNGTWYELLNRITTAGGRTMDQTVKIFVKNK